MKSHPPHVPATPLLLAAAILITMVLWGSAYGFIRLALDGYGPGELALLRYIVASLLLAVMAIVRRAPLPRWKDLPIVFVLGLLGIAVYHVALNWGEITVPSGTASLLIATSPVFTALLATTFLGERPGVRGWGGIAICSIGVALVVIGRPGKLAIDRHALLVLVASISAAGYTAIQKPYLRRYTPSQLSSYTTWAGTLLLLVFLPGVFRQWHTAAFKATASAFYLGIFPAAIGYITWTYILSQMPASRAVSVLYVIPPVAALFGWMLRGEIPASLTIIGGVVVVIGVFLVNTRGRPRVESSPDLQAKELEVS